jgi:aminodeoxyfutalosine deaminase
MSRAANKEVSVFARPGRFDVLAFIAAMPKVELHVHLAGAMPAATGDAGRFPTFAEFAAAYGAWQRRLNTGGEVAAAVGHLARGLAACRVRYAEVTVTPLSHVRHGIAPDELAEGLDAGRRGAAADHGVRIAWVFDVSGEEGEAAGSATVDWVLRHAPAETVGFGLGGPEAGVPRARFAEAFARARAAGLASVPHAGEVDGPESVWSALRDLRADRIGHGIQSVRDPALLEHLAAEGVVLEVCPTSNLCTGAVRAIEEHPLPALLAAGVPVSLATDNPGIFGVDLNGEYLQVHERLGVDRDGLVEIAATGIEAALCPPDLKARLRSELRRYAERADAS